MSAIQFLQIVEGSYPTGEGNRLPGDENRA